MVLGTTSLIERAESIFANLGYTVSTDGRELRAERKWRTVHVTAMAEASDPPDAGEYRCFVTGREQVDALERELAERKPSYDWAIIGVDEEDHEIARRSPDDLT